MDCLKKTKRSRSLRGNQNARKAEALRRVRINTSVKPETLAKIERVAKVFDVSLGRALDAICESAKV